MNIPVKEWIGPVLAVVVPLAAGGIHLEMKVAEHQAVDAAILQRLDRIERQLDAARIALREDSDNE